MNLLQHRMLILESNLEDALDLLTLDPTNMLPYIHDISNICQALFAELVEADPSWIFKQIDNIFLWKLMWGMWLCRVLATLPVRDGGERLI